MCSTHSRLSWGARTREHAGLAGTVTLGLTAQPCRRCADGVLHAAAAAATTSGRFLMRHQQQSRPLRHSSGAPARNAAWSMHAAWQPRQQSHCRCGCRQYEVQKPFHLGIHERGVAGFTGPVLGQQEIPFLAAAEEKRENCSGLLSVFPSVAGAHACSASALPGWFQVWLIWIAVLIRVAPYCANGVTRRALQQQLV